MSKTIRDQVAQQIANSGPTVTTAVVEQLAKAEIHRRTNAVVQGLNLLDKAEKELQKHKPDLVTYDDSGKETSSNWSKTALDKRNQARDNVLRIQVAIDNALEKQDYQKLFNLSGSKEPKQEETGENTN